MSLQLLSCILNSCLGFGNAQNSQNSAPVVSNTKNNGTIHSGFLVGTGSGTITVSIDGGNPQTATQNGSSWRFQLPAGSSTWGRGSSHTVTVSNGSTISYTLKKGENWDVNGDGYADIIVGAEGVNSNNGAAYIFYSSGANGISSVNDSSADSILSGSVSGGSFSGTALLEDMNMDGYADAIVSAAYVNSSTGAAYVFLSQGTNGIPSSGSSSAQATITGVNSGDLFGSSLSIGDINSDGYNDLAVCAYGVGSNNGAVYIFKGSGSGVASTSSSSADITLSGTAGGTFGAFIAFGDLNGDGIDDAVVGAGTVNSNNGAAYIFQSSGANGIASASDSSATAVISGTNAGNFANQGVLADLNNNGHLDIVIGAYQENSSAGATYIFMNPGSGFSTSKNDSSADSKLTGNTSDSFGFYLSAGDTNGDGYNDIITNGLGKAAYIFNSQGSSGISSGSYASASTTLTGSQISYSASLVDINGDGYEDALVGADSTNSNTGAAYIFNSSGSTGIPSTSVSSANATLTGTNSNGLFGHFVSP